MHRFYLTLMIGLLASLPAEAATLSLVDTETNGVGGVTGLSVPRRVLVSPDGGHVYVISHGFDQSIGVFSRDPGTGALSFVAVYVEGVDFPTTSTLNRQVVSPDGLHYYGGTFNGSFGGRILRFSRAPDGTLAFDEEIATGTGFVADLTFSPDGLQLYASTGDALLVWSRDVPSGALVLAQAIAQNKFRPGAARLTSNGAILYVADEQSDGFRAYARDAVDGTLTQIQKVKADDEPDVIGLSPDDGHLYATSGPQAEFDTYTIDPVTARLTFADHQTVGSCYEWQLGAIVESLDFLGDGRILARVRATSGHEGVATFSRDVATGRVEFHELQIADGAELGPLTDLHDFSVSPDGAHGYGVGSDTATMAAFAIGAGLPAQPRECRVEGKVLSIRNSGAGGAVTTIKWKSPDLAAGIEATDDDPRCNADPSGTVRATLRFSSSSSGADSGDIDLPCQNWEVKGPAGTPKRIYFYNDKERDDGPCKRVVLKGSKILTVACDNRGPSPLSYPLAQGIPQVSVDAVLTIGAGRSCARFFAFNGIDGSDGKKFLGKNASAPGACPP